MAESAVGGEVDIDGEWEKCHYCDVLFPEDVIIQHQLVWHQDEFLTKEEIDVDDEQLPCQFCVNMFPARNLMLHQTGCDLNPEVMNSRVNRPNFPQSEVFQFSAPKVQKNVPIQVEQLVTQKVFSFQPKNDGDGCVLLKSTDPENDETAKKSFADVKNDKDNVFKNDTVKENFAKNQTNKENNLSQNIHHTINIQNEDEEDENEQYGDFQPSPLQSDQVQQSSFRNSFEEKAELSDDNNMDGMTVESFLRVASIVLSKRKMSLNASKTKYSNCNSSDPDSEEEEAFQSDHYEDMLYYS